MIKLTHVVIINGNLLCKSLKMKMLHIFKYKNLIRKSIFLIEIMLF